MKSLFLSLLAATSTSAHLAFSNQHLFQSIFQWHPLAEFEANSSYPSVDCIALRGSLSTYQIEKCAYACATNVECTTFDYDGFDHSCKGYKYYGDYFNTVPDSREYTGRKMSEENKCEQCFDTFLRYDGSMISFVEHAAIHDPKSIIRFPVQLSATECQLRCKDVKGCKVFTYNDMTKQCLGLGDTYAKSVIKSNAYTNNGNFISGKRVTVCPVCDFPDNIIVSVSSQSSSS